MLLRTRHLPINMPEYTQPSNHPNGNDHVPVGVHLKRPWPYARVLFIEPEQGWVYVWWVDSRYMGPANGEPNDPYISQSG